MPRVLVYAREVRRGACTCRRSRSLRSRLRLQRESFQILARSSESDFRNFCEFLFHSGGGRGRSVSRRSRPPNFNRRKMSKIENSSTRERAPSLFRACFELVSKRSRRWRYLSLFRSIRYRTNGVISATTNERSSTLRSLTRRNHFDRAFKRVVGDRELTGDDITLGLSQVNSIARARE